jgi:protein SCO1/2
MKRFGTRNFNAEAQRRRDAEKPRFLCAFAPLRLCVEILLWVIALIAPAPARAEGPFSLPDGPSALPPAARAVDVDEHLGRVLDRGLALTDHDGRRVVLGDYLHGREPIVLVLAYYRCPMLCGLVLRGVVLGMDQLRYQLGRDFHALTVSIDPHDTPEAARHKRASALAGLGRLGDAGGEWPFLVGDDATVRRLADSVGFRYAYDAATDQYAHPAVAVVLTPDGHISRYLYGVEPSVRDLRLALVEAGEGKTGTVVDRVILTCYRYDPAIRRYGPYVFGFLRIGAVLVLALVAATIGLSIRHGRRRAKDLP